MSVEIANAAGSIDQFASSKGHSDLIAASQSNPALKQFFDDGHAADSDTVKAVVSALKALAAAPATAPDVASTAKGLASMMAGEDLVFITNGTNE
jgi:hypothetical protein